MMEHSSEMTAMETIYARRSVRSYSDTALDRKTILTLLAAAVQAPTAIHEEPWAFTVIQDQETLNRLSDSAKKMFKQSSLAPGEHAIVIPHGMDDAGANLFHNAGTLVVIWAKPLGSFVAGDCWLAAENLMLAACALRLGTCVIGSCVGALNSDEWKTSLEVPQDWTAIAPIIVGKTSEQPLPVPRKPAEIVSWRERPSAHA
jgi:nitroreductase